MLYQDLSSGSYYQHSLALSGEKLLFTTHEMSLLPRKKPFRRHGISERLCISPVPFVLIPQSEWRTSPISDNEISNQVSPQPSTPSNSQPDLIGSTNQSFREKRSDEPFPDLDK